MRIDHWTLDSDGWNIDLGAPLRPTRRRAELDRDCGQCSILSTDEPCAVHASAERMD